MYSLHTLHSSSSSSSLLENTASNGPRLPATAREVQPWTTTRCHRLLRPLKTHISALRREVELENAEGLNDEATGMTGALGTVIGRVQHTYSRRGRKATQPNPAAETPKAPKARKLSRKQTLQPGEIVLPTPLIRRARGQQQMSSPSQRPPLPAQSGEHRRCRRTRDLWSSGSPTSTSVISALEIEMLPLRSRISSTRYSLYESILRALHALLLATAEPAATTTMIRAPGTRSLMAMCLRKVPDYIGELEDWEERQAEEEGTKSSLRVSDVSNEVYGAVEQLLRPGHGCPQLRIVARAHGMKVVKDALLDGLLEDGFSHLLVQLCANMKASLEVEELLAIIVDRQYPKPKGIGSTFDESRRLAPLKALRNFVQGSGRSQYMLRQLSDLLSRQQLPLSWLSTAEFSSIWSGIINTLSSGNQVCDDTVSFATHMITTLASQAKMIAFILRPEANDLKSLSQQTLLSATTAMASLPLLHQEAGNISQHITGQNSLSTISRRVGHVIHACIYELRRARKSGWITTVLRLAAYFTSNAHDGSKYTDIPELWNRIIQGHAKRDGKQHYEAAIALICSIAQCCGRGVSDPSHHYLIRLCDRLDKAAELEAGMSRSLRINCAFLLAERTNDLRDLAFAESFDLRRASQHKPSSLSSPSLLVTGFRWDEGISEWVTETPAVRKRFSRQFSMEMTSSDSNVETRRRNVDDATDGDPHSSPLGRDFKDNPSTNQSGLYRMEPRQTRATARAGNSVRQSTIEQQYLMRGWKRGAAMAGLLSLQSDDDDLEDQCEDQVAGRQKESSTSRQQQQQQQRRCSSGKENTNTVPGEGRPPPPKRRRRVSALRPRQSVLTNITNVGPDEESSDELGL